MKTLHSGLPGPDKDGFLFSGNPHESVPRALFLDRQLTPLERNAWQVIRMMLEKDGITALPTYEQLRPYLTSMPLAEQASFETVSRALTLLRLTRWLTLAQKRRQRNGRLQSNLYILHDEPLTVFEALQLDPCYLELVCQSTTHTSKAISRVATKILQDMAHDPQLVGKRLPTRVEVLMQRVGAQLEKAVPVPENAEADCKSEVSVSDSDESKNRPLRNQNEPASESEASLKPAETGALRNQKADSTVSSMYLNTTTEPISFSEKKLPERFLSLPEEQQRNALTALLPLPPMMQQQVLREWDTRCQQQRVRKPAAYLFGIIQKAYQGEFNVWAGAPPPGHAHNTPAAAMPPPVAPTVPPPPTPTDRAKVQEHLQAIRSLVGRWKS